MIMRTYRVLVSATSPETRLETRLETRIPVDHGIPWGFSRPNDMKVDGIAPDMDVK